MLALRLAAGGARRAALVFSGDAQHGLRISGRPTAARLARSSAGAVRWHRSAAAPGRAALADGPSLQDFVRDAQGGERAALEATGEVGGAAPGMSLPHDLAVRGGGTFFVETYGCQMNVSDSEILTSILEGAGYQRVDSAEDADTILLNTCAIRDNAEARVWTRLRQLRAMRRTKQRIARRDHTAQRPPAVGVLGCMAERLKTRLLEEEQLVDLVAGPDAYRDLPALLHAVHVRADRACDWHVNGRPRMTPCRWPAAARRAARRRSTCS